MAAIPGAIVKITDSWNNILQNSIRLKKKDKVLFIFDLSVKRISEAFFYSVQNFPSDITPLCYPVLLQKRTTKINKSMPIYKAMGASTVLITALTDSEECTPFRGSLLNVAKLLKLKIVHMPGVRRNVFVKSTLNIDFKKLNRKAKYLSNRLTNSSTVSVLTNSKLTKKQQQLTMKLGNRVGYSDGGIAEAGQVINMPSGEAYIAPIENTVNGSIAISGTFGGCKLNKNEEILLFFENGKVDLNKSFFSKDSSTKYCKSILVKTNNSDPAGLIIGEFGIGVNPGIKKLTGTEIWDEKALGTAHIALGLNTFFGGKNKSNYHHDLIFFPEAIELDGKTVNIKWMRYGK